MKGWVWHEPLGKGRNGSVMVVHNPIAPNVVFKQGSRQDLEHEADLLHEVHHPNVLHTYGLFSPREDLEDCYLALERMDTSLGAVMGSRR